MQFISTRTRSPSPGMRYGVAVGVTVLGWLAREAITPLVGPTALPFIFFFAAVSVAAWYGDFGPGLVAAVLSAIAVNWFFTEPINAFAIKNSADVTTIVAFFVSCLFILWVARAMHRTRARLFRERAFLGVTLRSIGDAVISTDAKGEVIFMNPEAERLTGWTEAEAQGRSLPDVFRIVNEHTRKIVENPVEKVFASGKVVGLANHTILISKTGEENPISDTAAPIRDSGNVLAGVVLVFRDVTEERKAQEALTRLAAVVEFSNDVIFTKDLNGVIRSWNASAERLFGYKAEEIIGQPITILFPPDRLQEEDHILGQLRMGRSVERFETVRVAKDGRQIPVLISVSPIKDAGGGITGASKIVHDITKQKEDEEKIWELNEQLSNRAIHLEKLVQERTTRLNEIIADLEGFSYGLVHDLRGPLRAMQGFAALLLTDCGLQTDEARDFIERIKTAASRMDRFIQDGLNYSRIIRSELPLVAIDTVALIRSTIDTYPTFQSPHAEITVDDEMPSVLANEVLLSQCVSNLLGNAVKFVNPRETPKIHIFAELHGQRVRLCFRDNGIGIEKDNQQKIFEIFQRLGNNYEGTGIGLAIVKKAVERMGGNVGVNSTPGEGSTFWLELDAVNA